MNHEGMTVELIDGDAATPSGTYHGSKSMIGLDIEGRVKIDSSTAFDVAFTVSGVGVDINC